MTSPQPQPALRRLSSVDAAMTGRGARAIERVPSASADQAGSAEEVFRQHHDTLAGWCRRMVGDDEVARDIAAEAFVRLLGRWTTVSSPRAYLYTTALNLIRDRWRREERERAALRRSAKLVAVEDGPAPELRLLVESLPRRLQQVVVLHYFADLSVSSVADALGVAPGTVKRDLYDARARLAALLEDS